MATMDPEPPVKQELDDSGCVDDGSLPLKEADMSESMVMGQANLLGLSDDVLLIILGYCSPIDLKALGYSCDRLGALIRDRSLWTRVDARDAPTGTRRLHWMIANCLHEGTRHLHLRGYAVAHRGCMGHVSKEEMGEDQAGPSRPHTPTPYPLYRQHARLNMLSHQLPRHSGTPSWSMDAQCRDTQPPAAHSPADVLEPTAVCGGPVFTLSKRLLDELGAKCPQLTSLTLDGCDIDCRATGISMLPRTLKKLSLRAVKCYNLPMDKSFLFKIQDTLPELEELDVSDCEWMEPSSLLPLSKLSNLKVLIMQNCHKMSEFVAYASLSTRYGFKTLKVLDMRGCPVGDSEVSALGWLVTLEELYLSPPTGCGPMDTHVHAKGDPLPAHRELHAWEMQEPSYFTGHSPPKLERRDSETTTDILQKLRALRDLRSRFSEENNNITPNEPADESTTRITRANRYPIRMCPETPQSRKRRLGAWRPRTNLRISDSDSDGADTPGPATPNENMKTKKNSSSQASTSKNEGPNNPGPSSSRNDNSAPGPSKPSTPETRDRPGPACSKRKKPDSDASRDEARAYVTITRIAVDLNRSNDELDNYQNENENGEVPADFRLSRRSHFRITRSYVPRDEFYECLANEQNIDDNNQNNGDNNENNGETNQNNNNEEKSEVSARVTRSSARRNCTESKDSSKPSTSKGADYSKPGTSKEDTSDSSRNATPVRKSLRNAAKLHENNTTPDSIDNIDKSKAKSKGKGKHTTPKKQTEKRKAENSDSEDEDIEPKRRFTRSAVNAGASTSKSTNSPIKKTTRNTRGIMSFKRDADDKKRDASTEKGDSNEGKRDMNDKKVNSDSSDSDDEPPPVKAEAIGRFLRFRMRDSVFGCHAGERRAPEGLRPPSPHRQAPPQERPPRIEPRHHLLYVNVSERFHSVCYVRDLANRMTLPFTPTMDTTRNDPRHLVTDTAIRGFGRVEADDVNYVLIGPNGLRHDRDLIDHRFIRGMVEAGQGHQIHRPDRVNLRVLSVTGYPGVSDRSLTHLAWAAPHLHTVDLTGTGVTDEGVRQFKALRPGCQITTTTHPKTEHSDGED